jgi:uncharacterized protein (TIGR02147 family)
MANIFEYQDYRLYLKDFYSEQKASKKNFSYRSFSEKANINAPSFLFYVITGKRNLTQSTILKISQAIGHPREEADYFELLVLFNQATTITEKTHYYSKLVEIRKPLDISVVDKDRYEYYANWYNVVIREVVTFFDFEGDFNRLGSFLVPAISAKQSKESIRLLERLGFIERDSNGLYHQTQNILQTRVGSVDAFIIEKFQIEMLQVAIKAYENIPVSRRMTTSTTISISRETFELFKMRIRELQNQLMEMARIDSKPESVYQLTMNIFPISKCTGEDSSEKLS